MNGISGDYIRTCELIKCIYYKVDNNKLIMQEVKVFC